MSSYEDTEAEAVAADGRSGSNVLFVRSDSFSDSDHQRRATLRTNDAVTENAQPEIHSAFTRLEHDGEEPERGGHPARRERREPAESYRRPVGDGAEGGAEVLMLLLLLLRR